MTKLGPKLDKFELSQESSIALLPKETRLRFYFQIREEYFPRMGVLAFGDGVLVVNVIRSACRRPIQARERIGEKT
jgi:hypothetical protein